MTGAVASERVTEAPKGSLSADGNRAKSAKAEGSLTARRTGRAGTKVGLSDPVVESGIAIAQRIKATLGITGLSLPRVHIDGEVWHLDVGSSHPGAEVGPKGWAVRPLKWYASWVHRYGERGTAAAKPKAQIILCVLSSILATQMPCRSRRSGA